jgi:aspartyl-tRNA(Asn)/glutamyl-tRNA(Gln) amidotransferase subunit C
MAIDPSEVLRIARLARLKVDPDEARRLAKDLDRIVGHIDSLKSVKLPEGAEALTYFGRDVHRADESGACLAREDALRNAPMQDGDFFLVPKIVDKEES